jgi:hypothetical protein
MIRVDHTSPWVNEEWSCIFTNVEPPYHDFSFEIKGSVTGRDGHGNGSTDFVSPSGRVIIRKDDAEAGGDWHLNRSFRVLKTIVKNGDTVKWKTYSISRDFVSPVLSGKAADKVNITLFQGVPNTTHLLKIEGKKENLSFVSGLKIYRPYWNR